VDNSGCFTEDLSTLAKLPVLSSGNQAVIKELGEKVIHASKIIHSYPYDWRTKKPVITKTSKQWFVDTDKLKTAAAVSC